MTGLEVTFLAIWLKSGLRFELGWTNRFGSFEDRNFLLEGAALSPYWTIITGLALGYSGGRFSVPFHAAGVGVRRHVMW